MAAMLIRRSVGGDLLRRAGPTLLSASKQTAAISSLAASFLSTSSAAGAAARIRGNPIRSKGQCYRMLCDGSESKPVGGDRPTFLAKLKDISKGLVESISELNAMERQFLARSEALERKKGSRGQNKEHTDA